MTAVAHCRVAGGRPQGSDLEGHVESQEVPGFDLDRTSAERGSSIDLGAKDTQGRRLAMLRQLS